MSYYFPEELLIEILKRLPVKSLLRFRCVKKSWYLLIHSPILKTLHANHQKHKSSDEKYILYASISDKLFTLSVDNKEEHGEYYLPTGMIQDRTWHAISNGLICLATMSLGPLNHNGIDYFKNLYIWNPFIHKYITLPDPPRYPEPKIAMCATVKLAFGFVPKLNDYRVVKILHNYGGNKFLVDVYSLTTNSWKISEHNLPTPHQITIRVRKEVFANGGAFWLGKRNNDREDIIVCFDSENDVIREISLPYFGKYMDLSLRPYGESQLAIFARKEGFNVIDMWVSEEFRDINHEISWKTKKFTIDVQYGRKSIDFHVLGLITNRVIFLRKLDGRWELISYNLETKDIVSTGFWSSLGLSHDFYLTYIKRVTVVPMTESLILRNT